MKHTKRTITLFAAGSLALAAAVSSTALAGDETAADDAPKPQAPPSLDDLLGLEEETTAEETAREVAEEELQQRLTGEQLGNAFQQALASMSRSAELLDTSYDAGIGTQRIQQDVLTKLQQLIDDARRQQCSSSSSDSSQQKQQCQQQDPGRQQQQQQQSQQQQSDGDGGEEVEGPALQEGDINTMLEETRTEWGALPQRVRDMLLQGRQERFSSLYEQMTREYYRRLAEE